MLYHLDLLFLEINLQGKWIEVGPVDMFDFVEDEEVYFNPRKEIVQFLLIHKDEQPKIRLKHVIYSERGIDFITYNQFSKWGIRRGVTKVYASNPRMTYKKEVIMPEYL
ncbi:hypothetical protein [Mangrovibacillus cuniculi]|uniref:Uncharacterized protein n=1 Tax=Mangrovibacillus cuniculi TaxID=2593652 RepID=A0A7S8HFV0_9BACI|nr:hypothetical protein [Mangrovibacillus cuniculi]QPC47122.1 hypothetical protein G8O30_09155 [Mangrovibacillus cuniculi]